ncbi:HEPN domain-containing protein [Pokkaliibacter sp. MBI-7]|uniref:HEPN domain-containing protein n=1 Tax=Pokkaliibacter sp. MBI-7 TaxID=3040600 RepID=UPI0024482BEF|nr:HEPN domain-containing protein [Pokkaliibacter sp. MBI-7]MDH2432408.1 HEPN domain-containing protein [Pokkaliibacter sp. MBI-7]
MKTSLDHLPERKQHEVQTIATLLRDEFEQFVQRKTSSTKADYRILKIILFGSHAKGTWVNDPIHGYVSDYDILVLVNSPELVEEYGLWSHAEDRIQRRIQAPFSLLVHTLSEVNDWLHQGHYFFKDIREQGVELYRYSNNPLAQPGNLSAQEQKAIAEKHFGQWFFRAEQFFISFRDDLDRKWYAKAAFELHQAAERFLACTLLVCTNYLPRTHNLKHLRAFCTQQDRRFFELFPNTSRFTRRSFQRLKRAYVDARYSEHYEITTEELEWLASEVERLRQLTEEVCQARITALTEQARQEELSSREG